MTETNPTHAEDPAEGADTGSTDTAGRTPHPQQPAEGGTAGSADDGDDHVADEVEADAEAGLDPENRVTGA
ncbi:hypothetical protein TEK04_15585 [Klenkia sp. LSe6-5]|uniref:Uncharacterized protein n=1 Tax=Klenkia sesuvii TaxID=3103137 RepID=A0ABU8DWY9_9ACTN